MKIKKVAATLLATAMLVSTVAMSASAAETPEKYVDSYKVADPMPNKATIAPRNNHQDRYITIGAQNNSGGTPYRSPTFEAKTDTSYVYVSNTQESGGSLDAWVLRKKSSGSRIELDRAYGGGTNIPEKGPSNKVRTARGGYNYLNNWVYEDGYALAGLGFIMNTEGVRYVIAWSPDSV